MSLVGRHIGRYRILEQLGQGGMSVVYKGLDTSLDREVAVKVLHAHLAGKEESRKRLAREAKAVARLHHPNILEVFDFAGADAEEAYIVTELIRGKTLRQFLNDETLTPPEIAAMVVQQIAQALAHAHELSVIHRDLKPENVMLRDDGVLKLMDFGIAKIIDRDEKMTMTGALVGSPAHMAPEIIEGEEAGAEADVFSLGTMLYLFATGRLPFVAPNTTATLRRILEGAYDDPRQVSGMVSDELHEIIARSLMRDPAKRYANAGQLRDALTDYLKDLSLTSVEEELKSFFSGPSDYRRTLASRLTQVWTKKSEKLLAEKRTARALSAMNLVLAHDPTNARTLELLNRLKARRHLAQRLRKLGKSAGVILMAGIIIVGGAALWRSLPNPSIPEAALQNQTPKSTQASPRDTTSTEDKTSGVADEEPKEDPRNARANTQAVRKSDRVESIRVAAAAPAVFDAVVKIRPWGYLTVDSQARSVDADTVHRMKLEKGKHVFKVTCDACDPDGKTFEVNVQAGGDNTFNLVAPLKSSAVKFEGFPDNASVRIGKETRTIQEIRQNGFLLTMPKEGLNRMEHIVEYEVTQDLQTLTSGTARVVPGEPLIIKRSEP